jgi:iron complex outermembrane receptor protein
VGTFPLMNNPCEFGDRALAAGEITQTTWDNCQALGMDTTDAGELGFAWQSYQEYGSTGDLRPEESDTYTVGFVWDIGLSDGLVLSADYWNIQVDDVIGAAGGNAVFNTCITSENLSAPSCDVMDPIVFEPYFPGDIYNFFGNLGTLETDGIDFDLKYNLMIGNLGFKTDATATWVNSYKSGSNLGDQLEQVGTADGFAVFPEWRATVDFGLSGSIWSADLIFRWYDECEDLWRGPSTTADAVAEDILYTDLVGSFFWNQLRITGGINNLFDEDPPYFHSAFNANTEPGMYDVIGRRAFVSASWEW